MDDVGLGEDTLVLLVCRELLHRRRNARRHDLAVHGDRAASLCLVLRLVEDVAVPVAYLLDDVHEAILRRLVHVVRHLYELRVECIAGSMELGTIQLVNTQIHVYSNVFSLEPPRNTNT